MKRLCFPTVVLLGLILFSLLGTSTSRGQGSTPLNFEFNPYENNPVVPAERDTADAWDRRFAFGPSVMKSEGMYYLFYTGFSGDNAVGAINIGLATSRDGYVWQKSKANPLFDDFSLVDQFSFPVVFRDDGGQWVMMFSKVSIRNGRPSGAIYRATASAPQGPWTIDTDPILKSVLERWDTSLQAKAVVKVEGEYRLYYTGYDLTHQVAQMGLATSPDGLTWTFYDDPATTDKLYAGSDPIFTIGAPGTWDATAVTVANVLPTETGWELFYIGFEKEMDEDPPREAPMLWLGYATSPDGLHWTRYDGNPVIESDQSRAFEFTVMKNQGTHFLYYETVTPNGIGLMAGTISE